MEKKIIIRKFSKKDIEDVRRIACETAFGGSSRYDFFEDDEILADLLTRYYTDYRPGYCFVATCNGFVVGYIIGTKDVRIMNRIFYFIIIPGLFLKSIYRGLIFKRKTDIFIFHCIISFFKGEFSSPDFSLEYPATLHININKDFQRSGIGKMLIKKYLNFLKEKNIRSVHFGTTSEDAKDFFIKMGFKLLFAKKRTYMRYKTGKDEIFYVFGKEF